MYSARFPLIPLKKRLKAKASRDIPPARVLAHHASCNLDTVRLPRNAPSGPCCPCTKRPGALLERHRRAHAGSTPSCYGTSLEPWPSNPLTPQGPAAQAASRRPGWPVGLTPRAASAVTRCPPAFSAACRTLGARAEGWKRACKQAKLCGHHLVARDSRLRLETASVGPKSP